ncbi:MAG: 50S ribosomal protein L11 methyltransferase [Trueperaceae bacterium]
MRAWRIGGAAAAPLAEEGAEAAALWGAGATAVWIDGADLVAYFPDDVRGAPPGDGRWEEVPDVDHVAAYLAGLAPVDAGAVVVAPTHRQAVLRAGQQVVWLDPGTAFGTGHHESTRLALEALGGLPLAGRRVLDVGAGSGLLAIAADKLGAADALGIDIDADTVPVARANAVRNRSRARFLEGGFGDASLEPVDVLVANLYAELHVAWLAAYAALTVVGGDLLLSGILDPRHELVRDAVDLLEAAAGVSGPRLTWVDARRDGAWWLVHLRRTA